MQDVVALVRLAQKELEKESGVAIQVGGGVFFKIDAIEVDESGSLVGYMGEGGSEQIYIPSRQLVGVSIVPRRADWVKVEGGQGKPDTMLIPTAEPPLEWLATANAIQMGSPHSPPRG